MVSSSFHQNENLLKLKELSDKICALDYQKKHCEVCDYKLILFEIIALIEASKEIVNSQPNDKSKLGCYEDMCLDLKEIIKKVKEKII